MNLAQRLAEYGLYLRGVTRLRTDEMDSYGLPADRPEIALVGNIGSSYWPVFCESAEYRDGEPDPLDRWSRGVAQSICAGQPMQPLYPFEGPPYYPFQQWAGRAETLEQSPIGVMMHPEHGLWHSYRFALLGTGFGFEAASPRAESPCTACAARPCLRRCPVDAFDESGYDVARCARYLRLTPQAQCHANGCLARIACPVAPELRYLPAQGRFHLKAFLDAGG